MTRSRLGLSIAAASALASAACATPQAPTPAAAPTIDAPTAGPSPTPSASFAVEASPAPSADAKTLEIDDLELGTGAVAERGKRVRMAYVGRLLDGTEFDRTLRRPFEFTLGVGEVIAGWDRGVEGMRVGGKRRLVIPSELGYGAAGVRPTIPPNATLVFEVELLEVL